MKMWLSVHFAWREGVGAGGLGHAPPPPPPPGFDTAKDLMQNYYQFAPYIAVMTMSEFESYGRLHVHKKVDFPHKLCISKYYRLPTHTHTRGCH